MDRNFFYAIAVLVGTIVGAGMFGIPFVVAQSGFLIGAVFLLCLTLITLLVHLIYGEIVCRTKKKHRLVGYAERYLGKPGKIIVTFSVLFGLFGALLVYIIISGEFLSAIFSPLFGGSAFIYSLIFFIFGSFAVFKGLVLIERLELIMTLFLFLIVFLIFFSGLSHFDINNLKTINLKYFFIPYGVILWALAGASAIPEIKEVLTLDGKWYKRAIIWGTIIPAILYLLFMFIVVGVTGKSTTPESIAGLINFLGRGVVVWGAVFGALASMSSFFIIGLCLKKVFWYDYKIKKNLSWFLTCSIPLIGFLFGLREFIHIIGILGVILGAIDGTTLVLIYLRAKKKGDKKPEYSLKIPSILTYALIGVFIFGLIYHIIYSFR